MAPRPSTDVAFTASVQAAQRARGSRALYRRVEEAGGWETTVTEELSAFLAERDSFYLGTASSTGQPYVQHRGGPKGFVRVLGPRTLGFADYAGNRQFITVGNLAENDRAFLFFMDYAHRRRVKIWGRARVVEGDAALVARLTPEGAKGRPERVVLFEIEAWDVNCPQHIPQKLSVDDVRETVESLRSRVAELEAENATLREGRGRRLTGSSTG